MPRPAIRFYLHSVARLDGHRVLYVRVYLGKSQRVRLSTGYTVHPTNFSRHAPHLLEGDPHARLVNEKLAELSRALVKAYQDLEQDDRLSPSTFMPLLQQTVAALGNRPASAAPVGAATSHRPLPEQPLRAVLAAWQAGKPGRRTPANREHGRQCIDWVEKFDPGATPATVDEPWVRRYTAFLVRRSPLRAAIPQHLGLLQHLVAHAGLPAAHVKGGVLRPTSMCYLTWEQVQQVHAWQPPADKPSLARQKDVFVVRCLSGLTQPEAIALLQALGEVAARLAFRQQQLGSSDLARTVRAMLTEITEKHWARLTAVPLVSGQQTRKLTRQLLRGAGLDAPYLKVRSQAVVKRQQYLPTWQAATIHTAHHTYGALLARLQIDPLVMHKLLGYHKVKSTMAYVLLTPHAAEPPATGPQKKPRPSGRGLSL